MRVSVETGVLRRSLKGVCVCVIECAYLRRCLEGRNTPFRRVPLLSKTLPTAAKFPPDLSEDFPAKMKKVHQQALIGAQGI